MYLAGYLPPFFYQILTLHIAKIFFSECKYFKEKYLKNYIKLLFLLYFLFWHKN